jgi:hypothetical protein
MGWHWRIEGFWRERQELFLGGVNAQKLGRFLARESAEGH